MINVSYLAPLRLELLLGLGDALQVPRLLQDDGRLGAGLELALEAALHLNVVGHVGQGAAVHVDLELIIN